MKVFYSPYTLTPLKRANRLSSFDKKEGVLIKGVLGNKITFADYFPHLPLGDRSVGEFLDGFKFQKTVYEQKIFDLLLKDHLFQNLKPKVIFCHQLWTHGDSIDGKTLKYKIQDEEDQSFLPLLDHDVRLRLDANGLFDKRSYEKFIKDIPSEYYGKIDYMEDPLKGTDWEGLTLKNARDFIHGGPADFYIYKPNSEFKPKIEIPIIYSGYLGSSFGAWHAYCELIQEGDLSLIHGVASQGHYQEEKKILMGNYAQGFSPDPTVVRKLYQDTANHSWKQLCSI